MQFQKKNPYPSHGRSSEIPRGRGVLDAKVLEAKYETKLEFPGEGGGGEGGSKTKNLPWGEYGYFLELHIYHSYQFVYQMLCTQYFHLQMKQRWKFNCRRLLLIIWKCTS